MNTISLNTWEGEDADYNRFYNYGPTVRRAMHRRRNRRGANRETVQGGAVREGQGAVNLGLTVQISPRNARRVLRGNRMASALPTLFLALFLALLLASCGLWLLRGHDEGADRAAGAYEKADSLRIRGGAR